MGKSANRDAPAVSCSDLCPAERGHWEARAEVEFAERNSNGGTREASKQGGRLPCEASFSPFASGMMADDRETEG